jgi:hypothetical protein
MGNLASAIADFNRAIDLRPNEPDFYMIAATRTAHKATLATRRPISAVPPNCWSNMAPVPFGGASTVTQGAGHNFKSLYSRQKTRCVAGHSCEIMPLSLLRLLWLGVG